MIPGEHSFFIYRIDTRLLGLSLEQVDRVLPAARLLDPPQSSPGLAGYLNYQGQVIMVLNLRAILKLPAVPLRSSDRIVLVWAGDSVIGLIVDEALGVYATEWIEPAVADVDGLSITPSIGGFALFEDKMVVIQDLQKFLASSLAGHASTVPGAPGTPPP